MNPYFLSFRVPAKPGIAKDLIKADDIGRNAVLDFIDSLLGHNSIKCYKLIKSGGLRGQEEIVRFTKYNQPDGSLKERHWTA